MSNHPGKQKLEELVAGLDGVTPGPWRPSRFGFQIVSDFPEASWQSVVELRTKARSYPHAENEMESQETIANHLARCDPDTIRSISDAYTVLEAAAIDAEYALTGIIEMLDFDEDDGPDEPCDAEELCGRDVCDQCGCVKDKRDRLRQILGVSRHEG